MQINIFDGYAIYAIKDNTVKSAPTDADDADDTEQKLLPAAEINGGYDNG